MSTSESKQTLVQKIMSRFDKNEDDVITFNEFKNALLDEGVDEHTAKSIREQVFSNWDKNEDQKLIKKEIENMAHKWASFA